MKFVKSTHLLLTISLLSNYAKYGVKKAFGLFSFGVFFLTLLSHAGLAYAADLCPTGFESLCQLKAENAGGIANTIVSTLLILAIVLALIYLVYGGIKYITSGGDKGKIDAARTHITAAIIGLIIALAAFIIVGLVLGLFHLKFSDLKIPTLI